MNLHKIVLIFIFAFFETEAGGSLKHCQHKFDDRFCVYISSRTAIRPASHLLEKKFLRKLRQYDGLNYQVDNAAEEVFGDIDKKDLDLIKSLVIEYENNIGPVNGHDAKYL